MERSNDPKYKAFESDSDSDSEATSLGSAESLEVTSGPNFADFARSLVYDKSNFTSNRDYYYPFASTIRSPPANKLIQLDEPLPADAHKLYGKSKFESARKDVTSMFLIDSKNRDKKSYPQPTNFTLKPPRVYKNVVSIQVTQIKLLSSFFYFRTSKANTVLPVIERGREDINIYLGNFLTEAVTIPEGTYNVNDLLSNLQTRLNYTPIFYDFPNEFSEFVTAFTTNGDLSVNFNQPGDTYYDTLSDKYVNNPTMDQIVSYYWGNRYPGLTEYSLDQVKSAYYYPVIYELILDEGNKTIYPLLNQNVPAALLGPGESVRSHVVYNSSGLNDAVIIYLINNNLGTLNQYRRENTFRKYLVNRYQVAYDTNSLRVNIISLTLNTSLINLFNLTSARSFASALSDNGFTPASYSNISNTLARAKVIYTDMYNYIQNNMTKYFAIGFATYSSQYFTNTSNIIYIQNGLNASGIRTGYTAAYLTSGEVPIASTNVTYSDTPVYWPRFNSTTTALGQGKLGGGIDLSGINVSTSMIPYNMIGSNFIFGGQVIDSSNYYIQTDKSSRSVNSLITINPASYTVFKFRSPARQTLQVETLPLPYYYRFGDYNKLGNYKGILDPSNNNVPQRYFDISYAFVYNSTSGMKYRNDLMDSSNYSSLKLTPIFGNTFDTAFSNSKSLPLNVQSNSSQFEFTAPYPNVLAVSTGLTAYNTCLSFVSVDSNAISTVWADTVEAYIYHDRAAFMADLEFTRYENSNHYIQSNVATVDHSDLTFNISTFAGHKYYAILRSGDLGFPNMLFNPVIYYPNTSYVQVRTNYIDFDPLANPYDNSNATNYPFVTNYNTDFLRLPVASSLQGIDPANPQFTKSVVVQGKPIGYDISGISNDLTDYQGYLAGQPGFVPNTTFRIDPLSKYTFQALTPMDSNTTSYFATGSQNRILQPITNQPYTFKGTSSSQLKIVHWYDGYSIPQQVQDGFITSNAISSGMTSSLLDYIPGTTTPILEGFTTSSNGEIKFGQGINAIGFLPTDGLYEISSFTYKSVLYPTNNISTSTEDPNMKIKYIGVFGGSYLASKTIAISSALTVLKYANSVVYNPSTLSNTPNFGVQFGTWYEYGYDPSFVVASNVKISGYTQGPSELLSYDSMYYMVPFNSNGSNITYSRLAGSILPYPLFQTISTGPTYFGQQTKATPGVNPQAVYIIPSTIANANPAYGPQGTVAYMQSQYEQSQAITTTSIGFRDFGYLVRNTNAMFTFNTSLSNSVGLISTGYVGLTTAFTEYNDTLYLVNSLSNNANISNANLSFTGALYASSISTSVSLHGGSTDCIGYMISTPSTLQNYVISGLSNYYSTITYQDTLTANNITLRSYEFDVNIPFATVWLWGAGGGANAGIGGAGAYVKAQIDIQQLLLLTPPNAPLGVSTVYVVVGRGGDSSTAASVGTSNGGQGLEQLKYGGGGTSIYKDPDQGSVYYETRGGGFTGIFTNSNLSDLDTWPLIIVGGGGGGGNALSNLGGPGGFGRIIQLIPDTLLYFSSVTFTGIYIPPIPFTDIYDIDFNPGGQISDAIDGNLTSGWNPTGSPYMNSGNFNPTPKTYRANMSFGSNVSTISKLRLYLSPAGDTDHMLTGIVAYNNSNKTQLLFSNTNIQVSDMQIINNGTFSQYAYDITTLSPIRNTTINTNAWVMCGLAGDYAENMIQYSVDGFNWARVTSVGTSLPNSNANSILYVASLNSWFACGSGGGVNYGASAGLTWSSNSMPTVTISGRFASVAVSAAGQYQIASVGGFWISSNYGASWSATPITSGAKFSAISASGQYIVLSINNIINVSSNYGSTFTPITTLQAPPDWDGVAISASGQYMVVNAYSTQKLYVSSNYGVTWTLYNTLRGWAGVSISASGKYIIATTTGTPQISSNYGLTFSDISALGSLYAYASAISANGNYMVISGWNSTIRVSSNYGASWTTVTSVPSKFWYCATMSSSGRYITLGILGGGNMWVSSNFGVTWTERTSLSTGSWASVSMSGDGKYQLGVTTDGGSLPRAVYRSVALDPSFTSSPILRSTDGLNWTATLVTEYDGDGFKTLAHANDVLLVGGMRGSGGCILVSTDGYRWTYPGISGVFSPAGGGVNNIKYLNGSFWAAGAYSDGTGLKKSTDGITWTTVPITSSNISDIAYGIGRYVVAAVPSPPYNIGLIWSSDGVNWQGASPINIPGIYAYSIAFGNGVFVASAASVTDGSSYIKYSTSGQTWLNANFPIVGDVRRRQIKFANGTFMAVGECPPGTGRAANQLSAVASTDGINWTYTLSGAYNSDRGGAFGAGVDYGPISIIPNMSTIHLEIQKATQYQPYIFEIQAFAPSRLIEPQGPNNSISSLIDNNITTKFYPSETQTVGITSYPIIMNFSTAVSTINKLQFYAPRGLTSAYFTGLTVQTDLTNNVIFQDNLITSDSFINTTNYSYYETLIVPPLSNISSLFMNLSKNTTNSLQLIEARALYDFNASISSYSPTTIVDLNSRGGTLNNVIDTDISTFWAPTTYLTNDKIRLNFSFNTAVDTINRVQIYSGLSNNNANLVNGIYIYADSTKNNILYSNNSAPYKTYLNYNRFDLSIAPLSNSSTIYIELAKSSSGMPHINEINFFKTGTGTETPAGYMGGTLSTMIKSITPTYVYDGGGGSNIIGGIGGSAFDYTLDPLYVQATNAYIDATEPPNFISSRGIISSRVTAIITDTNSIDFEGLTNISGVGNNNNNITNVNNAISELYNIYDGTAELQAEINKLNEINFGDIYSIDSYYDNNTLYYPQYMTSLQELDIMNYSNIGALITDFNTQPYTQVTNYILPTLLSLINSIESYNSNLNTLNNNLGNIDLSQFGMNFNYTSYNTFDITPYTTIYNSISSSVQAISAAIVLAQVPASPPANTMTAGLNGTYLKGGSPGVVTIYPTYGISQNVGGGGGGGGYYGGGGGSRDGAGGGGAGYIYSASLFNLIDYGVAVPASNGLPVNYIVPGYDEQSVLLNNSRISPSSRLQRYGQGAYGNQFGEHGLAVFSYFAPKIIQSLNTTTQAFPNFVDGSRMALFKAPVTYDTDNRNLNFTNYSDLVETTSNAGYNWVWYRSYLSLVGQSLLTSMRPSGSIPSLPTVNFPNLQGVVYGVLADQYNNISTFYKGNRTSANISTITRAIGLSLDLHTAYLTQSLRSDPQYYELTEIYGLLDYLRNPTNLLRPHLDPQNPQLDRIFGGVPRFGYWANPFLTNTSYIGFDVATSQYPTSPLSSIVGISKPVTAMYGLVLEQSLSSGKYEVKDLMAYKPTLVEATTSNWLIASQFPESYVTRSMTNFNITSNVPVQPYTMKSGIQGQLPLFNYKVYTTPHILDSNTTINVPIHMINDFQGETTFFYNFQNVILDNVSSISLTTKNFTSTLIHINQTNITSLSNASSNIMGTVLSEYPASTNTNVVTKFGFVNTTTNDFTPFFQYNDGNGYYNDYADSSPLQPVTLGKGINDYNGNFYATDRLGGSNLYENICTFKVYQQPFTKQSFNYKSPRFVLSQYLNNISNPSYDYLISKYTNIWHVQGTSNISTIYGARLTSPYDFNITTNFVNQVFYPTHKIILTKKGSSVNPMIDAFDLSNYPSYPRTEMFYYKNYSSMICDISGQFAMEKTSNFAYNDMTNGYFFNSYINNINMTKSVDYNNSHPNSFNYLAIRAYSPSETFKALVRFYLPGRYDFGYISLKDLSNEIITIQTDPTVNPEYATTLGLYTSSFALNRTFGASGLPGFSGSNISSVGFGDFLNQYISVYNTINLAGTIASTVNGRVLAGTSNLITGDLRYILPSYIASRERVTDPIEFMLPLSTVIADSNRLIDEYGIGYNLGFEQQDTEFNTVQRAGSFFKILDDYIYLKMNEEFDMNRLDITTKEDLQATQDSTAQPNLYNCKLILNNFGTFATTFVQNPVTFNPIIGKLDKLKFSWYDITGQIIDNTECEWSGAIQIVEKMDIATDDSTVTKPA